jgi:dephospho-CoA kinase
VKVIGVVGKIGAGKDTLANYLAEMLNAAKLDISDVVRKEAQECGIGWSREELTTFSKEKINTFGANYFVEKIAIALNEVSENVSVISGIRTPQNVNFFRNRYNEDFILVSIHVSDDKVRYNRIRERSMDKDPSIDEQLITNDRMQEQIFNISETAKMADFSIENLGTLQDLEKDAMRLSQQIAQTLFCK